MSLYTKFHQVEENSNYPVLSNIRIYKWIKTTVLHFSPIEPLNVLFLTFLRCLVQVGAMESNLYKSVVH